MEFWSSLADFLNHDLELSSLLEVTRIMNCRSSSPEVMRMVNPPRSMTEIVWLVVSLVQFEEKENEPWSKEKKEWRQQATRSRLSIVWFVVSFLQCLFAVLEEKKERGWNIKAKFDVWQLICFPTRQCS